MSEATEAQREAARLRSAAWRDRKRRGAMLVMVEVEETTLAGLERLALLPMGERDPGMVAEAVGRFLAAARPVAAIGDALWPEPSRVT